jgi:hypothetical protein
MYAFMSSTSDDRYPPAVHAIVIERSWLRGYSARMKAKIQQDKIYCNIPRYAANGRLRAVLRVSTSVSWGDHVMVHVREWGKTARDPDLLVPCRGIALSYDELDAVLYALCLVRDDAKQDGNTASTTV